MISPGQLAYRFYFQPRAAWRRMLKEGGPVEQWKTEKGRSEMEAAAWRLPTSGPRDHGTTGQPEDGSRRPETDGKAVEIHLLTGRTFWYQTAFCLWSFSQASGREVRPVIHDDGSLKPEQARQLQRIFPATRVEWIDEAEAKLDRLLPEARFPALRKRRRELPLIKKITDVHVGGAGWTLFMDADLLFFYRPDFLLGWSDKPDKPLTSVDVDYAYGYAPELLSELADAAIRPLINTGLSGHRSDSFDWDKMEFWCRTLIERAGTHYYQEQALIALHVAGQDCAVLPPEDYITLPVPPEASACRAVMHHYVADSKPWYFRHNWRKVLQPSAV